MRFEGMAAEILLRIDFHWQRLPTTLPAPQPHSGGGYDVRLPKRDAEGCEDLDVALRVAEQSRVAVVPVWLVGYGRRRDSMSARTDRIG
jgi:hypothetical protein